MKIIAATLLKLLKNRHSDDICVPECKNGPTWTSGHIRKFDLWVMKKSYTNPMVWIYEIKVSRQDFLRDDKWQAYLPYCTDFYFVAPPGIIDVSEVPASAGLLISSKNATMLYSKKKAPHRNIEIPNSIYKYILMSRTIIKTNGDNRKKYSKKEYWQDWLENKKENQELGYNVSKKIRKLHDDAVTAVAARQTQIDTRMEKLESVKDVLKRMGFDPKRLGWDYEERIKEKIAAINEGFPEKDVVMHLENARLNLKTTINTIKESRGPEEAKR